MKNAGYLKYEINPRDFEHTPPDWNRIFNRPAPLALEIGCGNGEFLVAWARKRPEWNFIGIEISLESAERMQYRLHEEQVPNVRVIRDDARFITREMFADNSLHTVMMNFPDPWPKEKHRQHRVIIPSFVETLGAVLAPEGVFELVTDQAWYARDAIGLFENPGTFTVPEIEIDPEREVSTKYERKWREQQRKSYRMRAVKTGHQNIERILENGDMPHSIIKQLPQSEKLFSLAGEVHKTEDKIFTVKECFENPKKEAFLVRVVTKDGDYTQRFFLLVARHREGAIVKIDPGQQPYRTPAVKMAVYEIGRMLEN